MSHDIQVSALAEDEEYPVEQDGYPSPTLRRKSLGLSRPKHRVSVITYKVYYQRSSRNACISPSTRRIQK